MSNETTDRSGSASQHPNDMYGNIDARSEDDSGVAAPIPAQQLCCCEMGMRALSC